MEKTGALDYRNSGYLEQLCDAVISKLAEWVNQHLTFNQGVGGSNPPPLATTQKSIMCNRNNNQLEAKRKA